MAVLWIIALTVGLGFLTARFIIGPLIGYNAEERVLCRSWRNKNKAAKTSAQQDSAKEETIADQANAASQANAPLQIRLTPQGKQTRESRSGSRTASSRRKATCCSSALFDARRQELSDALRREKIKTRVVEIEGYSVRVRVRQSKKESATAGFAGGEGRTSAGVYRLHGGIKVRGRNGYGNKSYLRRFRFVSASNRLLKKRKESRTKALRQNG